MQAPGNSNPKRSRLKRFSRFLGKLLLGLILLFILLIFLLHSTLIQHRIAKRITTYLSASTKGTVEMEDLDFSLLGNVTIKGLKVLDPDSNQVLKAGIVSVKTNILDILSGDYLFDELQLEDVDANLQEGKEGLNINYIIKAFAPKAPPVEDSTSKDVIINFKKVFLHNVNFKFISDQTGTDVVVKVADLNGEEAAFNTNGNIISANKMSLDQTSVDILMKHVQDTFIQAVVSETKPGFIPDFGTNLGFDVKELSISNSHFASHRDTILITPKFDPAHVTVDDIQINISGVKMNPDILEGALHHMQVKLPGYSVDQSEAKIHMTKKQLKVTELRLHSDTDVITGLYEATYDSPTNKEPNAIFSAKGKIVPKQLAYFIPDDILKQINTWSTTDFIVNGKYLDGKTNLDTLSVITPNSQLRAYGQLTDITDPKNIGWENLSLQSTLGSDFRKILTSYTGDVKIPPAVQVQLTSSGNQQKMNIDGNVKTTWGNASAKGNMTLVGDDVDLDMKVSGQNVRLSQWIEQDWLGPINASATVKGKLGTHQDAVVNGHIGSIVLLEKNIRDIDFHAQIRDENIAAEYNIQDFRYRMKGKSNIDFSHSIAITNQFQLDTFQLGHLLELDSSFALTGNLATDITIDGDTIKGNAISNHLLFQNQKADYTLDTLSLTALLSPPGSHIEYLTDDGNGNLTANFDLQDAPAWLEPWMKYVLHPDSNMVITTGDRTMDFDIHLTNPAILNLAGMKMETFTSMDAIGKLQENNHKADVQFHSGKFNGYGIAYDTLYADLAISGDSLGGILNGDKIHYEAYDLGNLNLVMKTKKDTTLTDLTLSRDSSAYVDLGANIFRGDGGVFIYPTRLTAFDRKYHFDSNHGIWVNDSNVVVKNFVVTSDSMRLDLDGDLHAFKADFRNLDLTTINPMISTDEPMIDKGYLGGNLIYVTDKQLDLQARIDSLILYHSFPVTVTMTAVKDHDQVPFEFLLSNSTNTVDVHGKYFYNEENFDANMKLNVTNPEMFAFLYKDYLADMHGHIRGNASIQGKGSKPDVQGNLVFNDVSFTTISPSLTFFIKEDSIRLDNNGMKLDHFTMYDKDQHPLTISGNLNTSKFPAYSYDFNIKAENYDLINSPDTAKGTIRGSLVVNSEINLKGNEKDTYVDADVNILKNTNVIYVMANTDDALLSTNGIVEFVDPNQLIDTSKATTVYDSIVASLPDFNFHADVAIEKEATLKVITDEQSGDFFEATGGGKLEMGYDRTGNPHISGSYTIEKGKYRLSFYDLVKKTFTLVPGSTVHWSGSPESGEMDIKATYIVATNSLGLIGNEIGENEKAVYKRSLDYIVGINIQGTLEKPIITFTLDLPKDDRSSYPVLANKLDRLSLPEFQSDLNKQVFGLLVLGGFLPETSVADIDQAQVATTAIYNSVNALLATQLNRFASQYVKGVNIDVGIQSYADYSTPGGKTQTAMDFRVSKSVFNDRLSFEVGGDFDISQDQSGANTGDNYRGDVAIIYDLTGNGDKQLKLFNNESYDIIYQEIRNTGISLIFIREFDKGEKGKKAEKAEKKAKAEAEAKAGKRNKE